MNFLFLCTGNSCRVAAGKRRAPTTARTGGSEAEILPVFRASHDDIKHRVQALLGDLQ
jgi:hypothetical protein